VAHWKGFAIATGKAAWKTGAFLLKWGARPAAKGTVWTIKKVAVDPATKKIVNMKLVEKGLNAKDKVQAMNDLIKNQQCAKCGKKTRSGWMGGQEHFCSASCAQDWAVSFNVVEEVKVPDTVKANDRPQLVCGCARVGLFHGAGCAANKANQRIAENVRWSQSDPNHMKPEQGPDQRPMTKREAQLEAARQAQRANPPKKKWHGGY
jgi:endogenous inhibitor of DNA gyrase (YacG/DUF329 family)